MRVRFIRHATVQGTGYRPGDEADLADDVAAAYCEAAQALMTEAGSGKQGAGSGKQGSRKRGARNTCPLPADNGTRNTELSEEENDNGCIID